MNFILIAVIVILVVIAFLYYFEPPNISPIITIQPIQPTVQPTETKPNIIYYSNLCISNTNCMVVDCREPIQKHCMNTIETERFQGCKNYGGIRASHNYSVCDCINGICKAP